MKIIFWKAVYSLIILFALTACETEDEINATGEAATLYYSDCATIKGYVILEETEKIYVFQHEIDEAFQQQEGVAVYITFELEEPAPLTAECMQGEIITLTSIQQRS